MRLDAFARALTSNRAATDAGSPDPALRGRTYAIPFDDVWRAALELADGGLRGWKVVEADDQSGRMTAEATTPVFRFVNDVAVRIVLDENAQTRVDLVSESRKGKADLGVNRRRIKGFCGALDRKLGASATQILDPRASGAGADAAA